MIQDNFHLQGIFNFFELAEKLKSTLRHSWTSNLNRQESVAEHTWMMALLAMIIMPHLEQKLNQEKVLRMIILHDLAEVLTEDMPVWESVKSKAEKQKAERDAITKIFSSLDKVTRIELMEVWEEYEQRETLEARFVKAIDTLDVVAQHNATEISTWDDNDYLWQLSPLQDSFFDFDKNLRQLKDALDQWTIKKVTEEGELGKLDQSELSKRKNSIS